MKKLHSKKYRAAAEKIKAAGKKAFDLKEAIKLLKETSVTTFDSTAELHVALNVDVKKPEQNIRGTLAMPHGTGKKVRIAAIVTDDKATGAKKAGAAAAGLEDLISEFATGKVNYDVIVATPDVMKHLSKVAKVLGQKGMMPNPKSGTVTNDVEKTIAELMRGRIEFRNDKEGNVHTVFGKLSFTADELENNLRLLLKTIRDAKPSTIKGSFIRSITVTSTMGPGVPVEMSAVNAL